MISDGLGADVKKIWAVLLCGVSLLAADAYAQSTLRNFTTKHVTEIRGHKSRYVAAVEEFVVNNKAGRPAANLFATSYVRGDVKQAATDRPVVVLFNGGPSAAAIGVHMQFGPEQEEHGAAPK